MGSSCDSFSSALFHALERGSPSRQSRKFCVRMVIDRIWIQALWLLQIVKGRVSVWINKRPAQPAYSAIASHNHLFYV